MISQADDASLPMTFRVNPGPTHITFMSNGEEVGKLHLEDPLRFEGNTEASACVFFEHVVALDRCSPDPAVSYDMATAAGSPTRTSTGRRSTSTTWSSAARRSVGPPAGSTSASGSAIATSTLHRCSDAGCSGCG